MPAGALTATQLTAASIGLTAVSTVMSIQASRQQAKTQSALAERNAEITAAQTKEQIEALKFAGKEEQRALLEDRRRALARVRARTGARGVTGVGSPLIVEQDIARIKTQDATVAAFNTAKAIEATRIGGISQQQISLAKARSARATGRLQIGQELFRGGAQIAQTGLQLELAKNA